MVVCFSIAFRKRTNKAQPIDATMIPVNNTVKCYGDDIAVLPINTTKETYRYSESMLKHFPDDVLATFQKDLLYSNKKVIIKGNDANTLNDRRNHIAAAENNSDTNANINDRISKFNNNNALSSARVYRVPLRYLVDLGLVNIPTSFDVNIIFNLEQKLSRLFESKAKLASPTATTVASLPTGDPDANICWNSIPYIQYELVKLNDTFDKYITKPLQSKRVLRTGIKPTPYQKSYEVNIGTQSHVIEFKGLNSFHF